MTTGDLLKRLKPCDTTRPYIFISYSSENRNAVWADALRFQQDGYNIWLDEKNLDKTKSSWKEDALKSIQSRRCRLLLFYVSAASICSQNCLNELRETSSKISRSRHGTEVPFIAIDVEAIGNIINFCDSLYSPGGYLDRITSDNEYEEKTDTLTALIEEFFNGNNERVRIHPKDEPSRKWDYYDDIERILPDETRIFPPVVSAQFTVEAAPVEQPASPAPVERPAEQPATPAPKKEAPSKESRTASVTGDITYTLYGKSYTENQAKMMYRFFEQVLTHHPEQVADLPQQKHMDCVSHVDYEKKENQGNGMPNYFKVRRTLSFPDGSTICVGSSYGIDAKLKKMAALLDICGESRDIFSSDRVSLPGPSRGQAGRPPKTKPAPAKQEQAAPTSKKEKSSKRSRVASVTGDITYTLYGEEHTDNQSDMMCVFFHQVLERHPEQVAELPQQKYMNCVSHKDYEHRPEKDMPSYFKVCRTLPLSNGSTICVGTSYGLEEKLRKMAALLNICGESRDIFSSAQVSLPELGTARQGRPSKSGSPIDEADKETRTRGKKKKSLKELLG